MHGADERFVRKQAHFGRAGSLAAPANSSAEMRSQRQGLHGLITSIPAVPQGPAGNDCAPGATGPQGPPFAGAVVDGVTTLNPGEAATVNVFFDGTNVHFQYGIPRGTDGLTGATGPPGPPFAGDRVDPDSKQSHAVCGLVAAGATGSGASIVAAAHALREAHAVHHW